MLSIVKVAKDIKKVMPSVVQDIPNAQSYEEYIEMFGWRTGHSLFLTEDELLVYTTIMTAWALGHSQGSK